MSEEKQEQPRTPSMSGLVTAWDWLKQRQENQPALGAELQAVARQGREDLWNSIVPAFPGEMPLTREPGAPGTPTPQQTTDALEGRTSILGYELPEQAPPAQALEQEQQQDRGGREM